MRELTSNELDQVAGGCGFGGAPGFDCGAAAAKFEAFLSEFFHCGPFSAPSGSCPGSSSGSGSTTPTTGPTST